MEDGSKIKVRFHHIFDVCSVFYVLYIEHCVCSVYNIDKYIQTGLIKNSCQGLSHFLVYFYNFRMCWVLGMELWINCPKSLLRYCFVKILPIISVILKNQCGVCVVVRIFLSTSSYSAKSWKFETQYKLRKGSNFEHNTQYFIQKLWKCN